MQPGFRPLDSRGEYPRINVQNKHTILLKISGETLSGEGQFGFDSDKLHFTAQEIVSVLPWYNVAIVVGGGNLIRGANLKRDIFKLDVASADYMGMMATIINALALQTVLENRFEVETRVMSALEADKVCEPYLVRRAQSQLAKGRVVICAGGIGTPNFSTDTTMVIRAHELGAKYAIKGTKVDGIYTADPNLDANAQRIPEIGYKEYINRELKIVDATAVAQAMSHNIPIRVYDFFKSGNLKRVLNEYGFGSIIIGRQ